MNLKRDEWYWFEDKETGKLSEHGRYRDMDGNLQFARLRLFAAKKEATSLCASSEQVVKIKIVKVK